MSNSTNQLVQIIAYVVIATVLVGMALAFMIRRRQYSFGAVLIITAIFIYGFAFYVSQADNLTFDEDSPEMNPSAYGTPAFKINP